MNEKGDTNILYPLPGGKYWIRTSDPLLVRQVL